MRQVCRIVAIVVACLSAEHALALSFNFSYIDDASGTFASRGWLDPNSLFQRNVRAAANLWGAHFDSDATIVVDVDPHSYAARAGGTFTYGRFLYTNPATGKKMQIPAKKVPKFKPGKALKSLVQ